jgi:hypothetical protein
MPRPDAIVSLWRAHSKVTPEGLAQLWLPVSEPLYIVADASWGLSLRV